MIKLVLIKHTELSEEKLKEICGIKSIAWPFSLESQILWIQKNIDNEDQHVLLYNKSTLLAYLNLIDIRISIDQTSIPAYGVGNVCAVQKSKGYGKILIDLVNKYISKEKRIGLLFCKSELVKFYLNNNWKLIDKGRLNLKCDNSGFETMIFNHDKNFNCLEYSMKMF